MQRNRLGPISVFLGGFRDALGALLLLAFAASAAVADVVSVPFKEGFAGSVGANSQQARNITTFATLGISRVVFSQTSSSGQFVLQGNDIPGTIRLFQGSQYIDIPGAIVWRWPNSSPYSLGFIPSAGVNTTISNGATSVTITGGGASGASNLGVKLNDSTYALVDGANVSGNAANSGQVLTTLNDYLALAGTSAPVGPVTVTSLTTNDTTPTISGSASLASGETLSVTVDGVVYSTSNGLAVVGSTWSLTLPSSSEGTYSIDAIITNADGYTLIDSTASELTIDTTNPALTTASPADDATGVAVDSNIVLTFSEEVAAGSGNLTLYDVNNNVIQVFDVTSDVNISGNTITLNPSSNLTTGTVYYIKIDNTAVEDVAGNSYSGIATTTALNFETSNVSASLTTSTITASPTSILADGTTTSTITVQLKDANGNNLTTSGGVVALTTTLGTLGAVTDNGDGTYTATLTSASTAGTATISGTLAGSAITDTATVAFTDANAPAITGPTGGAGAATSSISVNEEQTGVTQLSADEPVTWTITGGSDFGKFQISNDGTISFIASPDYENPTDNDTNNIYELIVTATDASSNLSIQTISVTVLDVEFPGVVPPSSVDVDGDGVADGLESSSADRDGDGIPDARDYDPQGYFYCQADGRILPGGRVSVSGPGNVNMVKDGAATGEYQWFVDAPGTYTMTIDTSSMEFPDIAVAPNPTALTLASRQDNPIIVGSLENASTGYLGQFNGVPYDPVTPTVYYTQFVIAEGDANVFGNNIPFEGCADEEMVEEIREPLTALLQEEFEQIIAKQSRQFSDLAASALDRLLVRASDGFTNGPADGFCGSQKPLDIDGTADFGENGREAKGKFGRESYDCAADELVLTYGEFAFSDTSEFGTQGVLNFGFAREKQKVDAVRGRFWGGYLSRSQVDARDAVGDISGFGFNAGIYGARMLGSGLFLDYYGAAALGRHEYDLQFFNRIDAAGGYSYAGVFLGTAISGETRLQHLTLRPRAGFDLSYGIATDASVRASEVDLIETGAIELDPAKGFRAYLEADFYFGPSVESRTSYSQNQMIKFTPQLFCEDSFEDGEAGCGYGLEIVVVQQAPSSFDEWRLGLDFEQTSQVRSVALKVARERKILNGAGSVSSGVDLNVEGQAAITHQLNLRW